MNSYIMHFAIYAFSMVGFIVLALFIYKKCTYYTSGSNNKNFLKIENMLKLSPSKTVYVIKAGNEKFLIAGDCANTTMLAKLENNESIQQEEIPKENTKITNFSNIKHFTEKLNRG